MKEINRNEYNSPQEYKKAKSKEFEKTCNSLFVKDRVDEYADDFVINDLLWLCNTAENEYSGGYDALNLIDKILGLYGSNILDLAKKGLRNRDLGLQVDLAEFYKTHPKGY